MGGSDPADGVLIFSLTGRRVHIDNQGFKAKLSQRHGGGDTDRTSSCDDDVIAQFIVSLHDTPRVRNSEKIERRTSNVQHRTSNNDGAALHLF